MSKYPKTYRLPDGSIYSVTFENVRDDYASVVREFGDLTPEEQERDIRAMTESDAETWQENNWIGMEITSRGTQIGVDETERAIAMDRLKRSASNMPAKELEHEWAPPDTDKERWWPLREGEELYGADPECDHEIVDQPHGGVKCLKCAGWFCS